MSELQIGAFRGRKLIQSHGAVGGAKSVFVKLQGNKNDLMYPTLGGPIKNPFKGAAKMFAGDLCEYRTDEKGFKPEIYILKTYEVVSASGTTVNIVRDGYKHIPFVGDKIGVAPEEIGGAMEAVTVSAVVKSKVGEVDVWALTVSGAVSASKGDILVIGCSSSEIVGETIGHGSSIEAAEAVFEAIYPVLKEQGIYLAAQCCEHLNRALIIENECAKTYGLEKVCVVPQPKAGGSFATTAWANFDAPVAVEEIRAQAGLDIGGTLIGMHLCRVAVPVRLEQKCIGNASLLAARTRPKYIGGIRAKYE